jgi:hypothetical protein
MHRPKMLLLASCLTLPLAVAIDYFEGFDNPGKPPARDGIEWKYKAQLTRVSGWEQLIPGDGFAYLQVDRAALKARPMGFRRWPFQTLSLGPVTINHRIGMRAKNTAIPGVACLLFTYNQNGTFDEIDIEIVAEDTDSPFAGHRTGVRGGWTDVRLNIWPGANKKTFLPARKIQMPIIDADGQRVSHQDDRFHIYEIEWSRDEVRFHIDGVLQKTIPGPVPENPTNVIFGMRQMPWAGVADWSGSQTMLVDWIKIEPLDERPTHGGEQGHRP